MQVKRTYKISLAADEKLKKMKEKTGKTINALVTKAVMSLR